MRIVSWLARSLGSLLLGCACGGPTAPSPSTPATPSAPPAPAAARAGTYAVHEWGLLRAGPSDTLEVGALGPAALPPLAAIEKPVLYFHLAGDAPLAIHVASVTAVAGEIREHWPLTAAAVLGAPDRPTTVAWGPLTLVPERCEATVPIGRTAMPCAALAPGETCEALELARVVSEDASCVRRAESSSPFLFYRSTSRGLTVPLRVAPHDAGDLDVTNASAEVIPGTMVRIRRTGLGAQVLVFDPPAPGSTIVVGHAWTDAATARAALLTSMRGLGLTEGEALAFLRSWDESFFGGVGVEDVAEESTGAEEQSPPPEESILYFLPPTMVDGVATLAFEPAPTEVRRAMAVWTAL